MKTVLSISSILIMVAIYSTGAFVPESQNTVDTFAGLVILSDADMTQQVGGMYSGTRQRPEITEWPEGQPSQCYSSGGCGSSSGECGNSGECGECPPDPQVFTKFLHKCIDCTGYDQNTPSRKMDHDFEWKINLNVK